MMMSANRLAISLVAFAFILAACTEEQATPVSQVTPISQAERPPVSIPLDSANLALGNANWMAGLEKKAEWIWSGHLIPQGFENNLGKFFLHIPAVFEEQLDFSTTLIFDEPSFRNGEQMSGFVDRVTREPGLRMMPLQPSGVTCSSINRTRRTTHAWSGQRFVSRRRSRPTPSHTQTPITKNYARRFARRMIVASPTNRAGWPSWARRGRHIPMR
jgi:hypothetical protein